MLRIKLIDDYNFKYYFTIPFILNINLVLNYNIKD